MTPDISNVVSHCREAVTRHYGNRLSRVIVFGSCARNEQDLESDIDLLVVLHEPFDYFEELRNLIDVLDPVQLTCDRLISAKPASEHDLNSGELLYYRNIEREGIPA